MIKTDRQLLEENRDQARSMALALQAQIDLTQGRIMSMIRPDQEADRTKKESMLAQLKTEKRGHDMMVEHFDRMIEEAQNENIHRSDK